MRLTRESTQIFDQSRVFCEIQLYVMATTLKVLGAREGRKVALSLLICSVVLSSQLCCWKTFSFQPLRARLVLLELQPGFNGCLVSGVVTTPGWTTPVSSARRTAGRGSARSSWTPSSVTVSSYRKCTGSSSARSTAGTGAR